MKPENLYISDTRNNRVRKVAVNGIITTFAGNGGLSDIYGGQFHGARAESVAVPAPAGVAVDASGFVYVAHYSDRISKITPGGIITTIAGNGGNGYSGDNGPALDARFAQIRNMAADTAGNLYVADSLNHRIRKVAMNGTITTVAGTGQQGSAGDGGPATAAQLAHPAGVAVDASGNLYIADSANFRIRKVTGGVITTIGGDGSYGYPGDGTLATAGALEDMVGLAVDVSGRVYASGRLDRVICLTPSTGAVLTIETGHETEFRARHIGAAYLIIVNNAAGASPTRGTVTVTEHLPSGMTLVSMSGDGWNCSGNVCTRSDVLSGSSSYPPITVTVKVAADAPSQVTNRVSVSGGGSVAAGASDFTLIGPPVTITGRVQDPDGAYLANVPVSLSGAGTSTITTDAAGSYTFPALSAGAVYTVTPRLAEYVFTPSSRKIENLQSDTTVETFTGTPAAAITDPAGTSLVGSCVTFSWNTRSGYQSYYLKVGRSAGSGDYFERWLGGANQQEVCGFPEDGSKVYVELFTAINDQWVARSYTYKSAVPRLAAMQQPAAGAPITGTCATFSWTAGEDSQGYALKVGIRPGSGEYFDSALGMKTSQQVCGFPEDGSAIHVQLSTQVDGQWANRSYAYTSALSPLAVMTSPQNGATLPAACVTFNWTPGAGSLAFYLTVGRGAGTGEYFEGWVGLNTSREVCGLPGDGSKVYVQLSTNVGGQWGLRLYSYTSTISPLARITAPADGSNVNGACATLAWIPGTGNEAYYLKVGRTPATGEYFEGWLGLNTKQQICGLPADGTKVHVLLFTMIRGQWDYNAYTYTSAP